MVIFAFVNVPGVATVASVRTPLFASDASPDKIASVETLLAFPIRIFPSDNLKEPTINVLEIVFAWILFARIMSLFIVDAYNVLPIPTPPVIIRDPLAVLVEFVVLFIYT